MPRKKPDQDKLTVILSDAKVLGDAQACDKHGVSQRTLNRYKKTGRRDEVVTQQVTQVVQKVTAIWLEEAKAARSRVLGKIMKMVDEAEPGQIRDVVGALKIIDDSIRADRVVGGLVPEAPFDGGRVGAGASVATSSGATPEADRPSGTNGSGPVH